VKVVLFCGGLGVRMGEMTQSVPKPMITVGNRPILWHIMKYYASWGHKDFILCLGYRGESIKEYFLAYNEALSNDFVLRGGGKHVELLGSDISDWHITFAGTGAQATTGERLKAVEPYLGDDEYFLCTYGDGLTDAPLDDMIDRLVVSSRKAALFLSVRPMFSAHVVATDGHGHVQSLEEIQRAEVWINGGFMVLRRDVLDYIWPGEELVEEPFKRLIEKGELLAYRYEGFWEPMDTIKDKQRLDALADSGRAPWRRVGLEPNPRSR
jgi:glucose-1-phosphate cytidylyltransferase